MTKVQILKLEFDHEKLEKLFNYYPVDFNVTYFPAIAPNKHLTFRSLISNFKKCKTMNLEIFTGVTLNINGMTEKEIIDEIFKKPIKILVM